MLSNKSDSPHFADSYRFFPNNFSNLAYPGGKSFNEKLREMTKWNIIRVIKKYWKIGITEEGEEMGWRKDSTQSQDKVEARAVARAMEKLEKAEDR